MVAKLIAIKESRVKALLDNIKYIQQVNRSNMVVKFHANMVRNFNCQSMDLDSLQALKKLEEMYSGYIAY